MATRAADATIKGYYYQFDSSILKLLDLTNETDSIIVEGIEDIDIKTATETTYVQCKYLSKPKFVNSAVRAPIILMLDHFVRLKGTSSLQYVLYAHFEDEITGNEPIMDLVRLKAILTYSENKIPKHYEVEKKISDLTLSAFLERFRLVFGTEFYTQQNQVIQKLKEMFGCTKFEADIHFYNNALRIIIDKAIKKCENNRKITKKDFINGIDCRKKLFNEWFIKIRSKKEYFKLAAQSLKSTCALVPTKTKIVLISKEIINADNSEIPLESFILNLINIYYKLNSALRNAKPLTLALDCESKILLQVKSFLIDNSILYNDGFEVVNFSAQIFNEDPIINTSKNGMKVLKASYLIKLISKETLMNNIKSISPPHVFINFSKNEVEKDFPTGQFFDFKYCENLNEVHNLLASN